MQWLHLSSRPCQLLWFCQTVRCKIGFVVPHIVHKYFYFIFFIPIFFFKIRTHSLDFSTVVVFSTHENIVRTYSETSNPELAWNRYFDQNARAWLVRKINHTRYRIQCNFSQIPGEFFWSDFPRSGIGCFTVQYMCDTLVLASSVYRKGLIGFN